MVTLANIREQSVAIQIYALQRAAYTVEAQLIGSGDFPPLRETLAALCHCADSFLVYVEDGLIIGCLSYEETGTGFTISRLVVSPRHFRRGIASALLRTLENRLPPGSVVCALTADLNEPAIKAYEKQGYEATVGPTLEGIKLRRVRKQLSRSV
jgi:ribosomal protein S18 acetylase RimI-like enzyme